MCALFISLYVAESYFKCMNILIGDLSKSHNMWVESERKYDSTRVFFFCNLLVGFFLLIHNRYFVTFLVYIFPQ